LRVCCERGSVSVYVCMSGRVCVRERERKRKGFRDYCERESVRESMYMREIKGLRKIEKGLERVCI